MYLEYSQKNSKNPIKYWKSFGGSIGPGRNYYMFGHLTNGEVRDETMAFDDGIYPRGLPDDNLSYMVNDELRTYISEDGEGDNETTMETALKWNKKHGCKLYYDNSGNTPIFVDSPDWHSKSWLTLSEYETILTRAKENCNSENDYINFEYNVILDTMKSLESHGQETRLVFWFDN